MTYARQKYILDVEDGVFQVQRALRHTHVIGCMLSSLVVSHHSIYNRRRAVSEARASGIDSGSARKRDIPFLQQQGSISILNGR